MCTLLRALQLLLPASHNIHCIKAHTWVQHQVIIVPARETQQRQQQCPSMCVYSKLGAQVGRIFLAILRTFFALGLRKSGLRAAIRDSRPGRRAEEARRVKKKKRKQRKRQHRRRRRLWSKSRIRGRGERERERERERVVSLLCSKLCTYTTTSHVTVCTPG